MAIFPAVLVENLPSFLQSDAKKTVSVLLGQDREEVIFWRLHSGLPQFLVVFRRRENRDGFHQSKDLLEVSGKLDNLFSWYS